MFIFLPSFLKAIAGQLPEQQAAFVFKILIINYLRENLPAWLKRAAPCLRLAEEKGAKRKSGLTEWPPQAGFSMKARQHGCQLVSRVLFFRAWRIVWHRICATGKCVMKIGF
ncbi:MAG: hypothetical protein H6559_32725 [Lewinellaceae bacterium]|nr:hypothetical protein [Lewinellaceae bacterium]